MASTLLELLQVSAKRDGLHMAVVVPDRFSLSYAQLLAQVEQLRRTLHEEGIKPGQVVAIVLPNSLAYLAAFLAVASVRAVAAPLNMSYKKGDFEFYMSDTEAKLVIVPHDLDKTHEIFAAATSRGIPVWTIKEETAPSTSPAGPETTPVPAATLKLYTNSQQAEDPNPEDSDAAIPEPADVALFLHTSGTTSKPKGVPLTHLNLLTSLSNIADTYELRPSDVSLIVMPLFHVHGLLGATLSTLMTGGTVVVPLKFSATTFWSLVKKYNVTWYSAVPTIHQILLLRAREEQHKDDHKQDKPLRFIRSCSSSLAPSVFHELVQTFQAPVLEAYGMTEAAHQMSSNPIPRHGQAKVGSVGKPTGVEVSIRKHDADEAVEGTNEGEVCIKGANVTRGYHNRPEANKESFTASGWFRTGDQGYLDKDGYLVLTGRIKELINRGGEKISPLEIDAALLSMDSIADAVSFAAAHDVYGEQVACAVVPRAGKSFTEEDVKQGCATKLAAFKVPSLVFITNEFPRTATGKIQRRIVAAHFLDKKDSAQPEKSGSKDA